MKKAILLIVVSVALIVLAGARDAGAHSAFIRCVAEGPHAGQLQYHADSYTTGRYTIDGGTSTAFSGGFDLYRSGDHVGRLTITAPDWPEFSQQAGPCQGGTTSTSTPSSTTSPLSSTTTSTVTSTTQAPSTSTTPTTNPSSSPSYAPSTTAGPTSTTVSATVATPPSTSTGSSPPTVGQLPVTGTHSGSTAVVALCLIVAGVILCGARRRARP